ncbi:bifunctional aldolase/short-chain dehydrogenase [Aphanothece sacrum]|uniref:Short-chain dehydrogenase/reductase SDR n=1 Tax=Aphanothece sacrum FPU1 TaxID=1920663 RepID=A0A401IEQ3_APHSA|nr:bifunctional aldolase/short-chain dehydrogenase [Aphanothece sacrum]GBF79767.1 short-chain dehydrogenase/reductase SDR [Aphanothece sacrum FPU1]GBF84779.1 short-chain dehydrogenase/reductase SDR [Aphanothece sacrum FPU3]
MKSLWNDQEAAKYRGELGLRVYTSRLLGQNPSLVLHGGGNTSVKIRQENLVGETEDILYVKGSGWDLATIEEAGFSGVKIPHLLKLAKLPSLSDSQMVNELKTQMIKSTAPSPSVETILHAILPHKYVDHTHADAVVTITNTAEGRKRIEELYGDKVVIIPYIMPGFDLARLCAQEWTIQAQEKTIGMVLMNHGIFSFGETAQDAYEKMIELVSQAEEYLQKNQAWNISYSSIIPPQKSLTHPIAKLRYEVSQAAGFPVILTFHRQEKYLRFVQREDIQTISQQGPATPDHVIRTKILPLLGQDVQGYVNAYETYFKTHITQAKDPKTMLDPAPRIILDPELGLGAIGRNAKDAAIVADIYEHTIEIIERSTFLGGYQALSAPDLFDVEYWELEQAKLAKGGKPSVFSGEIALVTGAASGIGKACVNALLQRGAAVVGLDINEAITDLYKRPDFYGIPCDITDETAIKNAIETTVQRFGGLDMVILNAGIFPAACPIETLSSEQWRRIMSINLDANLVLMREVHPFLKLAPKGGRIVVIGSKNVPAPGPGVAAYSASKAALNQLTRVAALEWGKDNIRLNSIHPNGVFDTGIWTEEVLEARAKHYGLTVQEYKTNNVLKVEVTSQDVAELAAFMCDSLFAKTTAAQIPLDGGNERVI